MKVHDVWRGVCLSGVFPIKGPSLYHIDPEIEDIPDFLLWFPLTELRYRARITGTYESTVMEAIEELSRDGGTFWEVGAAWGYHSLAFGHRFDQIVCFEQNEEYVELLERSIESNRHENVDVEVGRVETLDNYLEQPPPDVVLMDIDGWEHLVMSKSPETIKSKPVWVIELHKDPPIPEEHVDPEAVERRLRNAGYDVTTINKRGSRTRFGRERDNLNNWHVVARPVDQ